MHMLKKIDLALQLGNDESEALKKEIDTLGARLTALQQEIKKAGIPVMVILEGWGTSGKGSLIGRILRYLDPRGARMYSITQPTGEEARKPAMNRFWLTLPAKGEIAVYDRSWYHDWMTIGKPWKQKEIEIFERQLTDDGYVIFKFFLHISKKEQKKRLKELESSKNTAWRVSGADLHQNKNYETYEKCFENMLETTSYSFAPWKVVSGMKRKMALRDVLSEIVTRMEDILAKVQIEGKDALQKQGILPEEMQFQMAPQPKLSEIDLSQEMSDEEYWQKLDELQKELLGLTYKLYRKKIPMVICYEGWDAAGKGGNIKRLVSGMDARDYMVHPVAAPTSEEKSRHFLWRFWKNIPKTGHIAIFDRTWYGRVMVERIEGFATEKQWKRAYNEINEFEQELHDWGAIIVKFWLQIDKDVQLERFTERQNTPEKQWKITDEDWRNREKWDAYEVAIDEMIENTSTKVAPWHIIESNNKHYARIKAIEIVIEAIKNRLAEI